MDNKEIEKVLYTRYTAKTYDKNKKISDKDVETLLESLRLAPSSLGLQGWHFFCISEESMKLRLIEKTVEDNKKKVENCSHLFVITTKYSVDDEHLDAYIESYSKAKNLKDKGEGFKSRLKEFYLPHVEDDKGIYYQNQGYIALGFLAYTAGLLGIDTTIMGGIDMEGYNEVLGLKDKNLTTIIAVATGYASRDEDPSNKIKVRFDKEKVITEIK